MSSADFFAASNVLVVAGKGGVGKTTVGAALAVAAASGGCHVVLVALEGYSGLGRTFGLNDLGLEARTVDPHVVLRSDGPVTGSADDWGRLELMQLRPDDALAEYLGRAGLGPVVNRFTKTSAVEVVATAAPGIRDLVTLGKIRQMEQADEADLIIVDAPASGHAISLLTSPAAMADSASSGPIRDQADQVLDMLADEERCQVLLVTLPEETPVTETVETAFALEDRVGVQLGPAIVNGVWPDLDGLNETVDHASDDKAHLAGRFRLEHQANQRDQLDRLADELPLPQLVTPYLFQPSLSATDMATIGRALTHQLDNPKAEPAESLSLTVSNPPGDPGGVNDGRDEAPDSHGDDAGGPPDAKVILCLGPGGVGKTTVSAAIGMALAQTGKRVVVLTIDPARRLADALGLEPPTGPDTKAGLLGNEPVLVEQPGDGELWATMLDPAVTFEQLVRSEAGSAEQAERILGNRLFKNLAHSLSGTNEYMAVERLHQLHGDKRFDVVVVDTPPSRHAVDFLDSPGRLTRFVDHRLYRSVFSPNNAVLRGVSAGGQLLLRVLGRMVGAGLVDDVVAFFAEFQGLDQGFRRRAAELRELLETDAAAVAVVAPRHESLTETSWILERINGRVRSFDLLVVNRAVPLASKASDPAAVDGDNPLAVNLAELGQLATAERRIVNNFLGTLASAQTEPDRVRWLHERAAPIRDLDGIGDLADELSDR